MNNLNHIKKMPSSKIKLNTMGCCFLCLKFTEENNKIQNSVSLKCLHRFLKINNNATKTGSLTRKETELEVDLCEPCNELMSKFSESFSLLELVQMEVDYLLERIHQTISDTQHVPDTVQNHFRMTNQNQTEVEIMAQSNSLVALRTEIMKQSVKRKTQLQPKVLLQQSKLLTKPSLFTSSSPVKLSVSRENRQKFKIKRKGQTKTSTKTSANEEQTEDEGMRMCVRNPNTGKYECLNCNKSFSGGRNARRHYEAAHLKKRYKCDACGYSYTYLSHLIRHKSSSCNPSKYPGGRPQKSKSQIYSFNSLTGMYSCVECKKELKSRVGIYHHYQSVHLKKSFKCGFCTVKIFKNRRAFRKHQAKCRLLVKKPQPPQIPTEMENEKKTFIAKTETFCVLNKKQKQFNENSSKPSKKSHSEDQETGKKNKTTDFSHLSTATNNPDEVTTTSTNQNNPPNKKPKLKYPIIIKKSKATGLYACPSCPRKFSSSSHAQSHYQSRHLRKRYECNLCGSSFARITNVKNHKKLSCPLTTGKVRRKRRAGPGEYECYFNQETQKYECYKCDNEFATRHSAWEHFRQVHSKKKKELQKDLKSLCPTNNPLTLTDEENLSAASEPVLEMKIIVKCEDSSIIK